ncbi:hypothetical protein BH11PLA2_BH11PLA2_36210 [soil metagenome]
MKRETNASLPSSTPLALFPPLVILRRVAAFSLLSLMLLAPPAVTAPALRAGDELVYTGDIVEESLRADQPFKRRFKVETRTFVLQVKDGVTDLAVMTLLKPVDDAIMAKVAVEVTGAAKGSTVKSSVKLELIRLDEQGGAMLLLPESLPPPLLLSVKTKAIPMPLPPNDGPNGAESGMFPPRPLTGAQPATVLDGTEVIEYATLHDAKTWSKRERIWISPADGLARVVWRKIENPIHGSRIETRLDLQPLVPHRGAASDNVRREIEFAWWFGTLVDDVKLDKEALAARIGRFQKDYPATSFREAIDSVARRAVRN